MPVPTNEADYDALLQIWALKTPAYQVQFGLTNDQITQIQDDSIVYSFLRLARQVFDNENAEFSAYKTDLMEGDPKGTASPFPTFSLPVMPATVNPPKPGIEKRTKELYNYFKNHPNRTDEALADLGILDAPKPPVSLADLKIPLGAQAQINDKVKLTFKQLGQSAVRCQMRTNGGNWTIVGEPTNSPFIDSTPSAGGNPEKREYRAIGLKNNEPVGQYSDIVTVYTTP